MRRCMRAAATTRCSASATALRDAAFDRQAASFSAALASAIAAVTSAVDGLIIVHLEPDELVTMAAIAERANLSRESIRLLRGDSRDGAAAPPGNRCTCLGSIRTRITQ